MWIASFHDAPLEKPKQKNNLSRREKIMALNIKTTIGDYQFNGPHTDINNIRRSSGVYAISTHIGQNNHRIIDVGESEDVQTRLANHDRKASWQNHIVDGLFCSAFYCDEPTRMNIETRLRLELSPPCGIR
jgi:hypothetical protein